MRDHKPSCSRHGRGHRTTRAEAIEAWSGRDLPLAVQVTAVDDDGTVVLQRTGRKVVGWHHDVDALRRALATGKATTFQDDVRLLHVGGPYEALGPWAFSLGDVLDHDECTRVQPAPRQRPAPTLDARSSFSVPYGPGGGREALVTAVARLLERQEQQPVRQAVIVSIGGRNLFTQALISRRSGVWLEAVSNEFIDEPDLRLGDDQHRLLEAFGYRAPSPTVPNHHQPIDRPATFVEVAELLVAPLEVVYGLSADDEVRVDVFPAPEH